MAAPRFAWGIDIGNRALKAVRLVGGADGLVIDDYDVVEHETVLSAAGDNRDSLVQTALATFVSRHPGIEKGQVGVSVNGQRTFAKFIKLPPVEKSKIPEIVKFEAIQQIPFPLDDVEWSYQLFQDPDSPDVEVGIFAMRKELVNAHIGFFTDAKLNVQVVQMSPLSVYNALYYDSRLKGTTMIVDLGAESTDLIIAEGDGVWLRSIPIGGNNFTEVLTKSFKVDFDKAEELKRNAATSKYSRQIVTAMKPVFADLVSEMQRSIGFYTSTHRESKIGRVIALGNTFRLPGLQRYLQQNLTLEVARLDHLGTSRIEDPKLAATMEENLLSSAGAYGLALQVMGQGKISSSLLPERIRTAKMWREKNKWFAAAAALFVAGAGVAYGSYFVAAGQLNTTANADLQQRITAVKAQSSRLSADWDQVSQGGPSDLQRVSNVEHLVTDHGTWPQINTLVYQSLPQFGPDAPPGFAAATVDQIKKVPRADRQQIVISAMTSKYYPDLTTVLANPNPMLLADPQVDTLPTGQGAMDIGGAGGAIVAAAGAAGAPAGPATRGYVLTLRCSTPNRGGPAEFVKYLNVLSSAPPTATRPWKIVIPQNSGIVRAMPVGSDAGRMSQMANRYLAIKRAEQAAAPPPANAAQPTPGVGGLIPPADGPGASTLVNPGMPGGGAAAGNAVPDEAYFDPITGEDVRNDTEATIVFIVELDQQPPAPAPGTPLKSFASATGGA